MTKFEQEFIERIERVTNENRRQVYATSSKTMMMMGIVCLFVIVADIIIAVFSRKMTIFVIFAVVCCSATAVYDFYKAAKFAQQAKECENDKN